MASENDQETDHKTSQETRKTSLLLQTDTGGRTNEQPNISGIKWKLRSSNRSPNSQPTRLWPRILVHQRNQTLISLLWIQIKDSWHNPQRVALPYITDRGRNTKIRPIIYAPKGKPKIIKERPERSSSGKSDRQRSGTWLVIAPNNWLIMSYQKCESRPAWGSIKILNRRERRTLYQKTCNPQLLFPRTFRTIREQPITEGHPPTMFLRILPPQDTPHDFSHAHKMAFKTNSDSDK